MTYWNWNLLFQLTLIRKSNREIPKLSSRKERSFMAIRKKQEPSEYQKALCKFHKKSNRHVVVFEADISEDEKRRIFSDADHLRQCGNELLGIMERNLEQLLRTKRYRALQKLYVANLAEANKELQELYDLEGSDKMQILKLLTRLRQLCLEPRLVYDNIDQPSSKLKACMELIKTMQENKQKVLLFSSFTSVLDLIAEECQKAGITYYMLTGSTNKEDRRELVSRFQKDDTTVFLISLKAGGTGLNLTSAEAVIHFDPWWNVSAQNQATDRAYRMGQKNNVQVFNLVMKDSVEEKIIELQKRKKELADMFVENNSGGLSQMSKEDILSLFTM